MTTTGTRGPEGGQEGNTLRRPWRVYLLLCGDGTLYCGIALDVEARLKLHQEGKGAKYTRGRGPLELVHSEVCGTKAEALRRERQIKRMSRARKAVLAGIP